MKVLFLDVDGVLNNWGTKDKTPSGYTGIDGAMVEKLARVVEATDCLIVLSSTWRRHGGLQSYLHRKLGAIAERIISSTPFFPGAPRGREIRCWLESHPKVTRFAILDDNDEMDGLRENFVQTRMSVGLTDEHCAKLIALLNT